MSWAPIELGHVQRNAAKATPARPTVNPAGAAFGMAAAPVEGDELGRSEE